MYLCYFYGLRENIRSILSNLLLDRMFEAIPPNECPEDADLPECDLNMINGQLCEANKPLPDGTKNVDVNNCDKFDVFRCKWEDWKAF